MQPADAAGAAGWLQLNIVAEGQRAAGKRAGNHGAEAADREDPVDRQAGLIIIDAQRQPGQGVLQRGQELADAGAGVSGKRDQRQLAQLRFCKQFRDLQFDQVEPFRVVNQIDLADDDNDVLNIEQLEDGQVFARLGHDAFVGGDDEQGGVDPADAGQHVFDEVAMPRHIHDADSFAARQIQPGKTEIDGHLAALLFDEPIGIDAAELFD